MRSTHVVLLGAVLVSTLACSSDPRQFRITAKNEDTFIEEIKGMTGLTVEESALLHAYLIRTSMAHAFGGEKPSRTGKTVGDLIDEQRKWSAKQKQDEDEATQLATAAREKRAAQLAAVAGVLTLTVYEKGFLGSDYQSDRYDDQITLKCVYKNTSEKDIRAFTGTLAFTDLFDKEISSHTLTVSDPVTSGESGKWSGYIKYNQFVGHMTQLRNADLKDLKTKWTTESVLFADGSALKVNDEP